MCILVSAEMCRALEERRGGNIEFAASEPLEGFGVPCWVTLIKQSLIKPCGSLQSFFVLAGEALTATFYREATNKA